MTERLRFDAIGMVTENLSASLDFYRRLGLDIPAGSDGEPHVEAALPGGMRLMWDTADMIRQHDPDWARPTGQNATLCVLCSAPAVVDEVHAELTGAGYGSAMQPFDAPWGQRYAGVLDPDGYQVQLFAWQ
ncbi:VOC family protein [Tsukamurella sp. 1534]|uniref:VOC family protein n=1 Tax=Tsukamurella sp. 1534 TaxID=1151061 RepID=UPI00192AD541|nr:VOC family protein [Tsukamurella sp. 1534]